MALPKSRPSEATEQSHRLAIQRAIHTMHEKLDQNLTLEDLAGSSYISPYHFNRIFHRIVGLPPGHFLSALRIQAARKLLVTTKQKVIDVCMNVGFASPGTFSRRFRYFVGLSPNRLRSLARCLRDVYTPLSEVNVNARLPVEAGHQATMVAPAGFEGVIFAGLFRSPLPQSRPVGCAILEQAGAFRLPHVPDGEYYLLALAVPRHGSTKDLLLYDTALRGGSTSAPIVIRGGQIEGTTEVTLRPAELTDPPILLTLPWLIAQLPSVSRDALRAGLSLGGAVRAGCHIGAQIVALLQFCV